MKDSITLSKRTLLLTAVGSVIVTGLVASAAFFMSRDQPQVASPDIVKQALVRKISKHYKTPVGEEPTLAKIGDKTKISQQPFFANAENGDQLLIYPKAQIAVLYRESEDKLVNVGPISIPAASATPPVSPGTSSPTSSPRNP